MPTVASVGATVKAVKAAAKSPLVPAKTNVIITKTGRSMFLKAFFTLIPGYIYTLILNISQNSEISNLIVMPVAIPY